MLRLVEEESGAVGVKTSLGRAGCLGCERCRSNNLKVILIYSQGS